MERRTLIEKVAFALFAKQMEDWQLPKAAAEIEWEKDVDLRCFWLSNAAVVFGVLTAEGVAV